LRPSNASSANSSGPRVVSCAKKQQKGGGAGACCGCVDESCGGVDECCSGVDECCGGVDECCGGGADGGSFVGEALVDEEEEGAARVETSSSRKRPMARRRRSERSNLSAISSPAANSTCWRTCADMEAGSTLGRCAILGFGSLGLCGMCTLSNSSEEVRWCRISDWRLLCRPCQLTPVRSVPSSRESQSRRKRWRSWKSTKRALDLKAPYSCAYRWQVRRGYMYSSRVSTVLIVIEGMGPVAVAQGVDVDVDVDEQVDVEGVEGRVSSLRKPKRKLWAESTVR